MRFNKLVTTPPTVTEVNPSLLFHFIAICTLSQHIISIISHSDNLLELQCTRFSPLLETVVAWKSVTIIFYLTLSFTVLNISL